MLTFLLKSPSSHTSLNRTKTLLLSKQSILHLELFLKKFQRTRAGFVCSITYQPLGTFCKPETTAVKPLPALLHQGFFHGRFGLELSRRLLSQNSSTIHQYKQHSASVSTHHSQITTISSLHFKSSKVSNLIILKIMLCFVQISSCWFQ